MSISNKILEYLRLLRIHSSASTASLLFLGALIMGQQDSFLLLTVFFIGLLGHFFGFVLNDYIDIKIDKECLELKKKPLVSGSIPKEHALIIVFLTGFVSYFLTIFFFFSVLSIILLTTAAVLGIIYNVFGKKILGLDFVASGSLSLFFLFGASTVSDEFTMMVCIVCLALFFEFIFLHTVEGGLKDADHDSLAGVKNLATLFGIGVKDGNLVTTSKFLVFAYMLKGVFIGLIILLSLQPEINLWAFDNYIIQIIVLLLISVIIITTYKLLHLVVYTRSKVKKLYTILNSSSLALIIILLLPLIGIFCAVILLILPIAWYAFFNLALYGKPMQPRV